MKDAEGEAWDEFWDTDAARCCSCPACNFYAPDYEQHKGGPCVLTTIIDRIADARAARPLASMPLERRDEIVAGVWRFLEARGYTIRAPGNPETQRCVCGHARYAHAITSPRWCLVKGGCDCAELEVAGA